VTALSILQQFLYSEVIQRLNLLHVFSTCPLLRIHGGFTLKLHFTTD